MIALLALPVSFAHAQSEPPIEAYAARPQVTNMTLSPNGQKVAMIVRNDDRLTIVTIDLRTLQTKPIIDASSIESTQLRFVDDHHLVVGAFENVRNFRYRGRFNYSAAISINLRSSESQHLMSRTQGLHPAQSGIGRIVGRSPEGALYMPAWAGRDSRDSRRVLYLNGPHSERGRAIDDATDDTKDWLINADGEMILRIDFIERRNQFVIRQRREDRWEPLLEIEDQETQALTFAGYLKESNEALLYNNHYSEYGSVIAMAEDGSLRDAGLDRSDADIIRVIGDINRTSYAVEYSGMAPSYKFFDSRVDAVVANLVESDSATSYGLIGADEALSKLLFYVFDGNSAGHYAVFDTHTRELQIIAYTRPDLTIEDVAPVYFIRYPARDGTQIPAVLTAPASMDLNSPSPLPTVILPHGGPRSFDSLSFDWMAQYFASRGMVVLQPNFRGSSGFGADFMHAGNGEWGGIMQDDVTDGLNTLIDMGIADPERVCIVGWSYGGYAALMGGAKEPEDYSCIVSINGVSDLLDMLGVVRRDAMAGHRSASYAYWQEMIGDAQTDRDAIEAVSPSNLADRIQAPVLLLHGNRDEVVDQSQSRTMERALRRANKDVELVIIRDAGHSILDGEKRVEMFTRVADFVEEHIG